MRFTLVATLVSQPSVFAKQKQALAFCLRCIVRALRCETHLGSWPAVPGTAGLPKLLVCRDPVKHRWAILAIEASHD